MQSVERTRGGSDLHSIPHSDRRTRRTEVDTLGKPEVWEVRKLTTSAKLNEMGPHQVDAGRMKALLFSECRGCSNADLIFWQCGGAHALHKHNRETSRDASVNGSERIRTQDKQGKHAARS